MSAFKADRHQSSYLFPGWKVELHRVISLKLLWFETTKSMFQDSDAPVVGDIRVIHQKWGIFG